MGKIRNVFIKQHQRGRWRYHWGRALSLGNKRFSLLIHNIWRNRINYIYRRANDATNN